MFHTGETYDIELGQIYTIDKAGNHTRVDVKIRDKAGKIHNRVGDGRQIGNFHPVWVNWKGEKITVEELLRR